MDPRTRLTQSLLRLLFVAAVATAPLFLFAEEFAARSIGRVAASNGVAALLCLVLLRLVRDGAPARVTLVGRLLVGGLLALVAGLAATNGEEIHVNVVNFVLVTVLASALLARRELVGVAIAAAAAMVAIAWRQAVAPPGEGLAEARLESVAQFLPTYAVIVVVLALRGAPLTTPSARSP